MGLSQQETKSEWPDRYTKIYHNGVYRGGWSFISGKKIKLNLTIKSGSHWLIRCINFALHNSIIWLVRMSTGIN